MTARITHRPRNLFARGEGNHRAKLTTAKVRFARECARLRRETPTTAQLARQWGISYENLARAVGGVTWKHV